MFTIHVKKIWIFFFFVYLKAIKTLLVICNAVKFPKDADRVAISADPDQAPRL